MTSATTTGRRESDDLFQTASDLGHAQMTYLQELLDGTTRSPPAGGSSSRTSACRCHE